MFPFCKSLAVRLFKRNCHGSWALLFSHFKTDPFANIVITSQREDKERKGNFSLVTTIKQQLYHVLCETQLPTNKEKIGTPYNSFVYLL